MLYLSDWPTRFVNHLQWRRFLMSFFLKSISMYFYTVLKCIITLFYLLNKKRGFWNNLFVGEPPTSRDDSKRGHFGSGARDRQTALHQKGSVFQGRDIYDTLLCEIYVKFSFFKKIWWQTYCCLYLANQ